MNSKNNGQGLYALNSKNNGQVFTPIHIVDQMLDECGLIGKHIFEYKIIEPSFGEGVFLLRLIERMKNVAREINMSFDNFKKIIQNNVFGIEKDPELHKKVMSEILSCVLDYNTEGVDESSFDLTENIVCGNTLEINQFNGKMDIVLGNPPWIRYHNIQDEHERDLIKSFSFTANGNTDIYVTFFEKGLHMLKDDGKLCFITPNSYFNSKMGYVMRKYITENQMLKSVINFEHKQIFEGFTTYSCITTITKQPNKNIIYKNNEKTKKLKSSDYYINGNFYFDANEKFSNIINYSGEQYIKVKNGCATLLDKFFIGNEVFKNSVFSKPAVKSSTGKTTHCFYPYDKMGEILMFDEIQYIEPNIAKYLEENKEKLLKRDIDKSASWYGFGRSQAISDTYKRKFALNTIYSKKEDVRLIKCPNESIVYGGIYVLGTIEQDILEQILYTDEYFQYVKTIGKYKNGGYYTIGSKEVENFINFSLQKMFLNGVTRYNT